MPTAPRKRKTNQARRSRIGCLMRQAQTLLWVLLGVLVVLAIISARQNGLITWPSLPALSTATGTASRKPTRYPTTSSPSATLRPTAKLGPSTPTATSNGKHVGILAGHSGPQRDPGAMCPDGLREADINLTVAEKVVAGLQGQGYDVDLLEEYDDRLDGYAADAFLSIHSDACDVPEASGFKVAHVSNSAIPEIEDILVDCLYRHYEQFTGLSRHDDSITPDMHGYYAFLKIDPLTPGAIIELGFMAADQDVLVHRQDVLASGIISGLLCFLEP